MADSNPSPISPVHAADEGTLAGGAMLLRETVLALEPGSVLAGRYQIRRVVGKGATGVVLEADDRVSRSLVALKVFKPEIATDDRWEEIVGSELRHARRLSHPNVCRVFDAGQADGYRFLSMEYATGGSLRQRLKDQSESGDRPMADRIADARAVVDGLAAIHEAGIIHRDVKPDNVLRMEDGRLVVTDFGLAVAPGQTTFMSGYSGAVGTPSYMAPEVALGGDATMASDVFALGVILHELFFDRRPEWATTKRGRFMKPPPVRKGSRVGRSMARLCLECLDQLAPRRPQNAGEVKKRFERAVLGRYGSIKSALKAGRWGIALGVLVAAGAVAATFGLRDEPGARMATVEGTAVDWSRSARLMARLNGAIHCTYPAADGKTVGVIWGEPRQAVRMEADSGQLVPWPLSPALLSAPTCPRWSPDGRRVAYAAGTPAQIFISDSADGQQARSLGSGRIPQWSPSGKELIFGFDRRRLATMDTSGVPSLLPEAVAPEESLLEIASSPRGDSVGVLYANFRQGRSALVTYAYPSWRVLRRAEFPVRSRALHFDRGGGLPMLVLKDGKQEVIARVEPDGTLRRQGTMGNGAVIAIDWLRHERLITMLQSSMSLVLHEPGAPARVLATSTFFGPPRSSPSGAAVLEQRMPDGRTVIAHYQRETGRLRRLTEGDDDRQPLLLGNRNEFVYLDRSSGPGIIRCPLDAPGTCRVWVPDPDAHYLLGASPTGQRIVYVARAGLQLRLRLGGVANPSIDLGPADNSCPVRWAEEDHFWRWSGSGAGAAWEQHDANRGERTGRREVATVKASEGCPPPDATTGGLRTATDFSGELWLRAQ